MGWFDSKNDKDNADYNSGYDKGRESKDPLTAIVDSFVQTGWDPDSSYEKGYKAGEADKAKHGAK